MRGAVGLGYRRLLIIAVGCTLAAAAIVTAVMIATVRASVADARPGSAASVPTSETLTVGIGRVPGGLRQWKAYMAAFSRLEQDLDRPVAVRLLPDESAAVGVFGSGEVDIALVTLSAYLRLEREGTAVLVAAPTLAGESSNAAMLVVRADSHFKGLEDLRGTRVALRVGSTAGEGYAKWLLASVGETPDRFFGEVIETESHDTNLEMLSRGTADATFVPRWDLAGWPEDAFRTLVESPPFGMPPVVARHDLDPEIVKRVRASLIATVPASSPATASALTGFVSVTSDDYAFARVLASFKERASESGSPVR